MARREQILEAAGRVFAEQGFHASKMKDVAVAAGVSNGTVYNYFKSKDEVLKALMHRLNETEQRESQFAEGLELEEFQDFLELMLKHRITFLWKYADVFRAVLSELLVAPIGHDVQTPCTEIVPSQQRMHSVCARFGPQPRSQVWHRVR